ncbi:MAG: hypothetical protein QUS08_01325 [Methanothrix sp.]|nr:hypothetical protein [Methanothrix sp.]
MRDERWPSIEASVRFVGETNEGREVESEFLDGLHSLLDRVQACLPALPAEERARCCLNGVMAEISIVVDRDRREVVLDKLYKYCDIKIHLFQEICRLLIKSFPGYVLVVPALEGYDLAKEIYRLLGRPQIDCIYLKGEGERLLMGGALEGLAFEEMLQATEEHYREHEAPRRGVPASMYHRAEEGEEEVLWMGIRVPLTRDDCNPR